jgi:hypothetical protein
MAHPAIPQSGEKPCCFFIFIEAVIEELQKQHRGQSVDDDTALLLHLSHLGINQGRGRPNGVIGL